MFNVSHARSLLPVGAAFLLSIHGLCALPAFPVTDGTDPQVAAAVAAEPPATSRPTPLMASRQPSLFGAGARTSR